MRVTSHLAEQPGRIQEGQTGTTVQLARQARQIWQLGRTPNGSTSSPSLANAGRGCGSRGTMQRGQPNFALRLDPEDLELLKQLAQREKLTRSDFVRRAIRKIAKEVGLVPPEKASVV